VLFEPSPPDLQGTPQPHHSHTQQPPDLQDMSCHSHATSQPHTAAYGPTRHVMPHYSHTQQPMDLQGTSCHITATHSSLRTYKTRHATSQPHTAASGPTRHVMPHPCHVMPHHSSLWTYKARHATSQPHTAASDSLYLSAADRQHVTDSCLTTTHIHTMCGQRTS